MTPSRWRSPAPMQGLGEAYGGCGHDQKGVALAMVQGTW